MTATLFVVGAGVGAVVRHLVNQSGLSWAGTLVVNVIGAFALGMVVASEPTAAVSTVIGVGLLGSLTTFSSFALEAAYGPPKRRALVIGATLVFGLAAGAAGYALG